MKRLDWGEIIRLRDAEGLDFAEIAKRMGKYTASIQKAYENAKRQGWTAEGPPAGTEDSTERTTPVLHSEVLSESALKVEEVEEVREMLRWWRDSERSTPEVRDVVRDAIPETPRAVYSFRIEKGLHEALKERSEQEGVSMADLVNAAIWAYLEGQSRGAEG